MFLPSQFPLFEGLTDPRLLEEIDKLHLRRFPKGIVIYEEGEESDEVYGVLSGSVEILKRRHDGEWVPMDQIEAGDIFGEVPFLSGSHRTTSAVVVDEVSALELSPQWLQRLAVNHQSVRERLGKLYVQRVLVETLCQCNLFSTLSRRDLEQLARGMTPKRFKDGETIYAKGDPAIGLIIVRRGNIELVGSTEDIRVGPGKLLGELSVLTGEAPLHSARAQGAVEVVALPAPKFQEATERFPRIVQAMQDVLRFRAPQTRQSLSGVVSEVVGNTWEEDEEVGGLNVDDLEISIAFEIGSHKGRAQLSSVSRYRWSIDSITSQALLAVGQEIRLSPLKHRYPEILEVFRNLQVVGYVNSVTEEQLATLVLSDEENDPQLLDRILTALAKAKVRYFIYPEYELASGEMGVKVSRADGKELSGNLVRMSLTHGQVELNGIWEPGEKSRIRFVDEEELIGSVEAICLTSDELSYKFQFEYETGNERKCLEAIIQDLAESETSTPSSPTTDGTRPDANSPLLSKSFRTPVDFIQAYLQTIESGLLRVNSKRELASGTPVKLEFIVSESNPPRRFAATGITRAWTNGVQEVEVIDSGKQLHEKVQELARNRVDDHAAAAWEKRKKKLQKQGFNVETGEVSTRKKKFPWL